MIAKTEKNSLLIVDDEKYNIVALNQILSPEYTVYAAKSGQDAIEIANEHLPDVILLDILMPEMDGYEVIAALKSSPKTRDIPVIFITGLSDAPDEEKGLHLGAADYISKPFSTAIVKLRIKNQIQTLNYIHTIELLSLMDQLTNIPNRRSFDERLHLEWGRAIRDETPISILILDFDNFKEYNDIHGHKQGDKALQGVAKILMQELKRAVDFVARWGGEEFVVLLPNTDRDKALIIAERMRASIEATQIPLPDGQTSKITISIGVNAKIPAPIDSADDFLYHADKALYAAKNGGRNRVILYDGHA